MSTRIVSHICMVTALGLVLGTNAAAQSTDLPDVDTEFRVGLHGSGGLSVTYLGHRPYSWRAFGIEVGVDYEMLNVGFIESTCVVPPIGENDGFEYDCSRNIWNAFHITGIFFALTDTWYTVTAGPSITLYRNGDEGSDPGVLFGVQTDAELGYKFIFLGASLRTGYASDPRFGKGFEMVWSPHIRIVLGRDQ